MVHSCPPPVHDHEITLIGFSSAIRGIGAASNARTNRNASACSDQPLSMHPQLGNRFAVRLVGP
jgi:hypothetical protein